MAKNKLSVQHHSCGYAWLCFYGFRKTTGLDSSSKSLLVNGGRARMAFIYSSYNMVKS